MPDAYTNCILFGTEEVNLLGSVLCPYRPRSLRLQNGPQIYPIPRTRTWTPALLSSRTRTWTPALPSSRTRTWTPALSPPRLFCVDLPSHSQTCLSPKGTYAINPLCAYTRPKVRSTRREEKLSYRGASTLHPSGLVNYFYLTFCVERNPILAHVSSRLKCKRVGET